MDFELAQSQQILKNMARAFLEKECPMTLVRELDMDDKGYSVQLQSKMVDLGWFGLLFPENYGGAGGNFIDLMVLLEEMGRVLLLGTFFPTVVLGGLSILQIGNDEQKQRFLPGIIKGELNFTLALVEPGSWYNDNPQSIKAIATVEKDEYVLNGIKIFVPYAHVADFIICVARTNEEQITNSRISLFIVDRKSSGVACSVLDSIGADKQCEVIFNNARVPKENLLGELNHGWVQLLKVRQKAVISKCAEMIGGTSKVLEMSVDYSKQRVQFGQPIGNLQIIQNHCVEMLNSLEEARLLTCMAGWMLSQGIVCEKEVSMAKARASEAFQLATCLGHIIHGGVGYTLEHALPFYFKRAKSAELMFGDADFHREKIAIELGL